MKAKKISCGMDEKCHSLVQFEDDQQNSFLYSVAEKPEDSYEHLGISVDQIEENEHPFRVIQHFKGQNVVDFVAHDGCSMVIIGEQDDYLKHDLPDGRTLTGMLHFYKKDGKWVYVSEDESKTHEFPDICFAIKSPMKGLEANDKWPDLEKVAAEILSKETFETHEGITDSKTGSEIKGPLYQCQSYVGKDLKEFNFGTETILADHECHMHPHIFYRVQKKLKPESKLPALNLHEFYAYDHQSDIQLSLTPWNNFVVNPKVVDYINENHDNMLQKLD
jgi:hypothetical protein